MPLGTILQFPFGGALTAANLNAPVNSLKALVDAWYDAVPTTYFTSANMVSTSTPNKGVLRDASAGFSAGAVLLQQPAAGGVTLLLRAFDATTQSLITGQTNAAVSTFSFNNLGAGTLASLVLSGSPLGAASGGTGKATNSAGRLLLGNGTAAMTELAGAVDGQVAVWSAGSGGAWLAGGVSQSVVTDSLATPGSAAQINVAAQKPYVDSNGQIIGPLTASVAGLPTQPTGTHFQYVAISRAPGTGSLTVTPGTLDAAESTLVVPQGNDPIASVLWSGVTTLPSGIVPAANIKDVRGPRYGLGSASSGVAGTIAALTSGNVTATYPNTKDVTDPATSLGIHPTLVRQTTATASVTDLLKLNAAPRLLPTLSASGATVRCQGTVNAPVALEVAGQYCVLTTTVTSNAASGAAATYYLFADRTPATLTAQSLPANAFTIAIATSNVATATQRLIGSAFFDGTNMDIGASSGAIAAVTDLTPMQVLGSGQMKPTWITNAKTTPTAVSTTTFLATVVGNNVITYCPQPALFVFTATIGFDTPSLVGLQMEFTLGDVITGAGVAALANVDPLQIVATSTSQNERRTYAGFGTLSGGNSHVINLYARCLQASQSFNVNLVRINGLLFTS